MKKINIKESLLEFDKITFGDYDLAALYESCDLSEDDKKKLVQYIDAKDIDATNKLLSNKASEQGLLENISDDISDEEFKELASDMGNYFDYVQGDKELEDRLNKIEMNEDLSSLNAKEVRKYVYNKISKYDDLTDDDSSYWEFDVDISNRSDAKLVYSTKQIPRTANYKFSLIEDDVDIGMYYDYDDDTWYVLDNLAKTNESFEDKNDRYIIVAHKNGKDFYYNTEDFLTDSIDEASIYGEKETAEDDVNMLLGSGKAQDFEYITCIPYEDESINESFEPTFDGWEQEDIDLFKSIDWKERNFEDYPVPEDNFIGNIHIYGLPGGDKTEKVKFIKYIRPNPIFPPYYAPESKPNYSVVGPMYDGRTHGAYDVHDRYETQEVYDLLSEDVDSIEKVVSEYDDAFYHKEDGVINCDSENSCNEIAKRLGISKDNVTNSTAGHWIYLNENLDEGLITDLKSVGKAVGKEIKNSKTYQKHVQPKVDKVKNSDAYKNISTAVKDTDTYQTVKKGVNTAKGFVNTNISDKNKKASDISFNVNGKDYLAKDLKYTLNNKEISADEVAKMNAFQRRKVKMEVPQGVKPLKEDIDDPQEVLTFKRNVQLADNIDDIQDFIYHLSDGVAEENCQTAFYENEGKDLQTLKDAVISALDIYLQDSDWLGEGVASATQMNWDDDDDFTYDAEVWEDDMGVVSHKEFFAEGSDYSWMKRVSSVEHLDFDNWAVWSAFNHDTGKTEYFVVEEDTEFIDWGPVDTEQEAKEFLQSKVDDYNLDESVKESYSEEESLKAGKSLKEVLTSERSIEEIDGVRYAYDYLTQEDLSEVKDIVLKLLRKEFPNSTFEVYSITLTYDELSMGVLKDDVDFNRGVSIKLNRFDYSDNLNKVLNNYTPQLAHELIDEMKATIFDMSTEESLKEDTQLKFDDDMINDIDVLYGWRPQEVERILIKHGSNKNNDNWIDGLDLPAAYDEIMSTFKDKYSDDDEIDYDAAKVLGLNESLSATTSSGRYWYFTRHGVQPGSIPKYVNILDIVDTPEGSYFLADGVILTNDLREYEIKERKPDSAVVEESINESNDVVYDMYKKQYKNLLQDIKYLLNSDNIEDIRAYDKESQGEYILSKLFDSRMNKQNMSFEDAKEDVIDFLYKTRVDAKSELELRNKRSLESKSIMNKVKSELSKDYKLVSELENTLYFKAPDNSTHDDCIAFVDKVVAVSGGKYTSTGRGGSWTLWDILTPEGSYIKAGYDYSNKDNYAVYFRSILTESRSTRSTSKESNARKDSQSEIDKKVRNFASRDDLLWSVSSLLRYEDWYNDDVEFHTEHHKDGSNWIYPEHPLSDNDARRVTGYIEDILVDRYDMNRQDFKVIEDKYSGWTILFKESKSIKESTKWSKSGPSLYTLRTAKGKAEVYKPVNSKQFELTVYDNNGNYIVGPTSVNNYYPSKESAMQAAEKYLVDDSLTEASAGFQKEFYKDYVILKNRAGDGWDVYSYEGTPEHVTKVRKEDEGYATLNDAKKFIDSLSESLTEDVDTSKLKSNIKAAVNQVMSDKGYDEDEIEAYTAIEIKDVDENFIEVEVRAELGYDDLMYLCDKLDPIIAAVDPNAYFEPVTSGIASAFVRKDQ